MKGTKCKHTSHTRKNKRKPLKRNETATLTERQQNTGLLQETGAFPNNVTQRSSVKPRDLATYPTDRQPCSVSASVLLRLATRKLHKRAKLVTLWFHSHLQISVSPWVCQGEEWNAGHICRRDAAVICSEFDVLWSVKAQPFTSPLGGEVRPTLVRNPDIPWPWFVQFPSISQISLRYTYQSLEANSSHIV